MFFQRRWLLALLALLTAFACDSSSTGCSGFEAKAPGTYQGPKLDSAGALRVSAHGLSAISGQALLDVIAPGGTIDTELSCDVTSNALGSFTVADQGGVGCADESCGRADGKCDAKDKPQPISIQISAVAVNAASPDLVEIKLTATVQTGLIILSSVDRTSSLCLLSGGGPVKCSIDFDSAREVPNNNVIVVELKLALRNGLLSVEVADLGGTKACGTSGAGSAPECIDSDDIEIKRVTGGCNVCGTLNSSIVKNLLIDQLTKSLKDTIGDALSEITCQSCGGKNNTLCPTNATCKYDTGSDAGVCMENVGGLCSPVFLGIEGHADLSEALSGNVVPGAALDLSIAAGGLVSSAPTGVTIGMRGGLKEVSVASCVAPRTSPTLPNLPLPNFDLDGPAGYDVAFSLSQQLISEGLFHSQQAGALCLEIGTETVSQLDSATLETFLPSLKVLTQGNNVPLRVIIRPVNPPTATVGAGTFDGSGKPLEPLVRLNWPGLELDVYATIEEQQVRLFTISADLDLPLGLKNGCGDVTLVFGDLMGAVKKVEVKNSELLAEDLTSIGMLVPTLLKLAEPAITGGLDPIKLPKLGDSLPFRLEVMKAKGVGQIAGTSQYNHLGVFVALVNTDAGCP